MELTEELHRILVFLVHLVKAVIKPVGCVGLQHLRRIKVVELCDNLHHTVIQKLTSGNFFGKLHPIVVMYVKQLLRTSCNFLNESCPCTTHSFQWVLNLMPSNYGGSCRSCSLKSVRFSCSVSSSKGRVSSYGTGLNNARIKQTMLQYVVVMTCCFLWSYECAPVRVADHEESEDTAGILAWKPCHIGVEQLAYQLPSL